LWIGDFSKHAVYLPEKVNERSGAPTPVGRRHRAMFRVHQDDEAREELALDLDEIARQGARRMLAQALEAEVGAYIEAARDQRDEHGHALVVRNGRAREREVLLGAGAVEVRTPRVNDRRVHEDGNRKRFKRARSCHLTCAARRR
jgi:Transposase, Mutator family